MLNIAILGFGLIGSGTADVFFENESVISKKLGDNINIKYILDIREINHALSDRLVHDYNIILNDPEIVLIIETMGGLHPAFEYTKAALERGINVVTPNKELVANYGALLLKIAMEHDVRYFFEASVGGGIPIIRPMYNCLAANKINKITAILNGTTNFILTKMSKESVSFDDSLKSAQESGFAERDPSSDVNGIDTCRKICILSSLAFGRQIPPQKVHTEGISCVTLEDIRNTEKINFKIKLIAKAEKLESEKVYAITAPMLVSKNSPLYNIEDVFNGIVVTGNVLGDVMFYGRGAGKLPTASAVAADVIDALTKSTKNICWEESDGSFVSDYKKNISSYYIRLNLNERDLNCAFDIIKDAFANAVIYEANNKSEIFFITDEFEETEYADKINILKDAGLIIKSSMRILK